MTETTRKFAFKKSALADKADKIWSESKLDFTASARTTNHVHLEKKSLGDVLEKIASKPKDQEGEDQQNSSNSFVFGSKISDRVIKNAATVDTKEDDTTLLSATDLFKTAVKKDDEKPDTRDFRELAKEEAERVKEAMKQQASTSIVELTTGEEADENIFQASCKIWVFDKEKNKYVEKGVSILRINKRCENGRTHHRIVARTSGTLKVVINSKIFADMVLERPDKRIRISAMGPESKVIQVFLLKFGFSKTETGAEAEQFFNILSDLLKLEKGEQSRKRKADCDLNAESVKIRDAKDDESKSDEKKEEDEDKNYFFWVDEGFVILEKPRPEEEEELNKEKDDEEKNA
ncbi:unnamed protein product [Caenorhabditis bovis]|uniref:RanBD1 domain-containing protein n=1 Tax=Caenorhabditis bovis TaxID=2654633 RepID=A0A8S1EVU0_9PELO|nr:unnamed protein product [Caenorhabditis bovis]